MKRFIEGADRNQATLFPERLDEYVSDDSPVRAIDAFVDALDWGALGFGIVPEATGRPVISIKQETCGPNGLIS